MIMSQSSRKKYDPAFKQEAVSLWKQSHNSAEVMAEELGIKPERM